MTHKSKQELGPESRLGFLIYRAGLAVARGYERALTPLKATPVEAGVLSVLAYNGPNHVRELGRTLGVSRQTIVNVTKTLEEAGLISRTTSPTDARLVLLTINRRGHKRLSEIEQVATAFDQQLREIIGSANEPRMIEHFKRILLSPLLELDQ